MKRYRATVNWSKLDRTEMSKLTAFALAFSNVDLIEAYNEVLGKINAMAIDMEKAFIERYGGDRSLYEWYRCQWINKHILEDYNVSLIKKKDVAMKMMMFGERVGLLVGVVDDKYLGIIVPDQDN